MTWRDAFKAAKSPQDAAIDDQMIGWWRHVSSAGFEGNAPVSRPVARRARARCLQISVAGTGSASLQPPMRAKMLILMKRISSSAAAYLEQTFSSSPVALAEYYRTVNNTKQAINLRISKVKYFFILFV